jgi:RNA polymerase sigma-70 factor (ECF subfamily)
VEGFLEALAEPLADGLDRDALGVALDGLIQRARNAWPGVAIDESAFVAHVARHVAVDTVDVPAFVDSLRAEDLFLAWSAGRGDRSALDAFEARYFVDVMPALARVLRSTAAKDEVEQRLRERLFVARPGEEPAVWSYAGRGDLRSWTRVAIARTALNLATRGPRDTPGDEMLFDALPDTADDPEIGHLRERCRAEVREAFQVGVRSLEARERNLLRHAFLDGLGIDAIGGLYGVHRATAARWLSSARAKLLEALRADLQQRLKLDPDEMESLLRWAQSGIDISLERCFAAPE